MNYLTHKQIIPGYIFSPILAYQIPLDTNNAFVIHFRNGYGHISQIDPALPDGGHKVTFREYLKAVNEHNRELSLQQELDTIEKE